MAILTNTIGSAKWLTLLLVAATTASFSTSAVTTATATATTTTASVKKTGAGCGELLFSLFSTSRVLGGWREYDRFV
jgi:hypothetical protein